MWVVAGALSWAVIRGSRLERFGALAPLTVMAPLLGVSYFDDSAYHLLRTNGRTAATLGVLLLGAGMVWRLAPSAEWLRRHGEGTGEPERDSRLSPATLAPITGLALMLGVNDALFEPLGTYQGAYGGWLLRGVLVVGVAALIAGSLRLLRVRLAPVASLVAVFAGSVVVAGWIGIGPGAAAAPAIAVLLLAVASDARFWAELSRGGRWVAGALAVLGFVAAFTLADRFGLGAREVAAVVPNAAERVPVAGVALLALVLAARGALAGRADQTSRSAATGGMPAA
ncbi:MAG TPA: hypothetical protein VFX49_14995 [Chloroflexota bacterium]|nr:hypothetical protein [Chloroflexota bacterium]